MNRAAFVFWPLCLALPGCLLGKLDYVKPSPATDPVQTSLVIPLPLDQAWKSTISKLSARYFVVNNLDPSSGFINLSYSGDPEQFVDCGVITSKVDNAAGLRTYTFPGARARQRYEYVQNGLFAIDRTLSMEGRINLVLQSEGSSTTRVTINARYVLNKTVSVQQVGWPNQQNFTDSIAFNSGQLGTFAAGTPNELICVPTGKLERDVLSALQQ